MTFDSYEQTLELEDHDATGSNNAWPDLVPLKANL